MPIRLLTSATDLEAYDVWVKSHPQGNLWQSVERMTYIQARNKDVRVYAFFDSKNHIAASAMVVIDGTRGGLSTWEIPRGPLWNDPQSAHKLVEHILREAKKAKALTLYIAPSETLDMQQIGFVQTDRHVHAETTRILDLTLSDEQLLAQMHQKGRYNMNVARKNGVHIEQSNNIDAYYELAKKTGSRDGFTIPNKQHLHSFLESLPGSFLLLAHIRSSESSESSESSPIAGLIGVAWQKTGIYYYGASDYEYRNLMAPYLLQWEAIQLCKKAGCTQYDLLGIAPVGSDEKHHWAGISSFKEKFGGTVISYPPEQEITLRPMIKRLLSMKRKLLG